LKNSFKKKIIKDLSNLFIDLSKILEENQINLFENNQEFFNQKQNEKFRILQNLIKLF
jgi:hypothetical protein